MAAGFWLTACGGLASPDPNGNLPQKQNTNQAIVVRKTTIEKTPASPPTPAAADDSPGINPSANPLAVILDKLIIPVAGIKPESLRDTFKDARSENRVHDAIDIMAAGGTPVLATADGEIARFFDSERGGITIYQFSRDKRLIYYYAHLQSRAAEIQEHQFVRQGTIIGYVGDTGNAGTGNFHLHFAIWIINDPKRYFDGTNINPYPLLH